MPVPSLIIALLLRGQQSHQPRLVDEVLAAISKDVKEFREPGHGEIQITPKSNRLKADSIRHASRSPDHSHGPPRPTVLRVAQFKISNFARKTAILWFETFRVRGSCDSLRMFQIDAGYLNV
jgi:hypothetical protein